jgi:uracil-DNA glycosylase
MEVRIHPSWREKLSREFNAPYFAELAAFVKSEYAGTAVYPPAKYIFRAFDLCPFDQVKVVILGQDPYHGACQATGLSFSVAEGVATPPSLRNIFTELESDLQVPSGSASPDLTRWAAQGVLLLNATLTVRAHQAGSHQGKGWERFTDAVIAAVSEGRTGVVFILWGRYAREKGAQIDRTKHLVLESAHPSPFSAASGFFGSRPFSRTNEYLESRGETPIAWV